MKATTTSALVIALFFHLSKAKVTITKFEKCNPATSYPIEMDFKIKENDDMQVLEEGSLSSKVELGNNILDVVEVYTKETSGWEHLVDVKENLCDAMNKYMGDFMHDIQEAAGLARGTCPVPAGDYEVKEHTLDFQKVNIKSTKIPDGDYQCKVSLLDVKTNETLHCHVIEFTIKK